MMKVEPQSPGVTSSGGAHIRSRITVVCAECKRLKLKCDRRTPCSSCLKRDTVQRCLYSAAAAEKIDVQSLHNRILTIESRIDHLSSLPPSTSHSHPHSPTAPQRGPGLFNDRAIIATGHAGSSVVVSLEDVSGIWLETLDFDFLEEGMGPIASGAWSLRPQVPSPSALATPHTFLPSLEFYFKSATSASSGGIGVTPSLISLLPSAPMRDTLLAQLEHTMALHPCFNFPHFKGRVMGLYAFMEQWGGEEAGEGVGEMEKQRASLSFFAAACAGFALAARILGRKMAKGQSDVSQSTQDTSGEETMMQEEESAPNPNSTSTGNPIANGSPVVGASGSGGGGASTPSSNNTSQPFSSPLRQPSSLPQPTSEPTTKTTNRPQSPAPPDPANLYALSTLALTLHESQHPYDLDTLIAMLLTTLYHLHEGGGSIPHVLFPMVGKMVNVCRMMGMGMDPSDVGGAGGGNGGGGGKYGVFESEMRRRIWWDVYFYDLFVSDAMGQAPLIQDDVPTCRLPSDVNEDTFGPPSASLPPPVEGGKNFGYFALKCRLAQLVKSVKRRTYRDPLRSGPPSHENPHPQGEYTIDQAIAFESEIAGWISDLPPLWRLNMLSEPEELVAECLSGGGEGEVVLMAQRCEIASICARLVIRLFVPFLKRARMNQATAGGGNGKPPHHAVHACVNAAHTILHASRVAHALPETHSENLFYSFGRQLFDAAVISAHSVITAPQSLFAKVAMEDLRGAVEIVRGRGGSDGGDEALKIVELLQTKAEAARSGAISGSGPGSSSSSVIGVKRKHHDVEDHFSPGFHLPYVGAGVVTTPAPAPTPASASAPHIPRPPLTVSRQEKVFKYVNERAASGRERERERERERDRGAPSKAMYPGPGPGQGVRTKSEVSSEGARSRAGSIVGKASTSPGGLPPPSAHPLAQQQQPMTPISEFATSQGQAMPTESAEYPNQHPPPFNHNHSHPDAMMHYHNGAFANPGDSQAQYEMYPPPGSATGDGTYYMPSTPSYHGQSHGYETQLHGHGHHHPMLGMHPPHAHPGMDTTVPGTPRDAVYKTDADDTGVDSMMGIAPYQVGVGAGGVGGSGHVGVHHTQTGWVPPPPPPDARGQPPPQQQSQQYQSQPPGGPGATQQWYPY